MERHMEGFYFGQCWACPEGIRGQPPEQTHCYHGGAVGGVGVGVCPPGTELDTSLMSLWARGGLVCWCGGHKRTWAADLTTGWLVNMWNSCTVPGAAKHSCQVRTSFDSQTHGCFYKDTHTHSHTLLFCPRLPDQLFIVKGLGWLSSQDVDLTLEDRQVYFALHILLGLVYAVSHKITLRTVPETWGEQGNSNIYNKNYGCKGWFKNF